MIVQSNSRENNTTSGNAILTEDRNMIELLQLSETVAKSKAAILIQGESGAGKKMLAKLIHQKSQRLHETLEILDCSSVSRGEQEKLFFIVKFLTRKTN